ncbi:hypothetical protein SAMN06264364_11424 [Quadrisphaera granulorum]|uniref:Uncharacterized protein n=1 Tax=Quadrisphaera granulorum TaxID=317664 RepID=A0A316A6Q8_9ACTN|nr:hypothetical protein [Quadrisphaera granulorum]PWJ53129.1 hypothetical protein BXY45_11424 [Quadrisphaera granulorum]SZE97061.1 hypothetical protein SAMN06264364_11424 [Quadrisphaera granulorum]
MISPDRGALRVLRSAVLALFVVGLSAAGHALGGGHLPSAPAMAALAAAVAICCAAATRWRLPAGAAAGLLTASQVVLHALLERLAPAAPAHTSAWGSHAPQGQPLSSLQPLDIAAHGGHPTLVHGLGELAPAAPPTLWLGGPTTADSAMLLAHCAVAVALALVYSRGEDALWALCAWLAPLVAVVVAVVLPVLPRRQLAPGGAVVVARRPLCVLRGVRRRGPPVLAAG